MKKYVFLYLEVNIFFLQNLIFYLSLNLFTHFNISIGIIFDWLLTILQSNVLFIINILNVENRLTCTAMGDVPPAADPEVNLLVSVQPQGLSPTDQQEEGDGQKQRGEERKNRRQKEEEGSSKNFLTLEEFFPPSPHSFFFLSLWCHSMGFTGPSWVEDLQWKTSEFLRFLGGTLDLDP